MTELGSSLFLSDFNALDDNPSKQHAFLVHCYTKLAQQVRVMEIALNRPSTMTDTKFIRLLPNEELFFMCVELSTYLSGGTIYSVSVGDEMRN